MFLVYNDCIVSLLSRESKFFLATWWVSYLNSITHWRRKVQDQLHTECELSSGIKLPFLNMRCLSTLNSFFFNTFCILDQSVSLQKTEKTYACGERYQPDWLFQSGYSLLKAFVTTLYVRSVTLYCKGGLCTECPITRSVTIFCWMPCQLLPDLQLPKHNKADMEPPNQSTKWSCWHDGSPCIYGEKYTCKTHGELLFLEPDTGLESQIPDIWSICLHDPGYMVIGYMVIPDTWSILAGPDTDDVSGTHCSSN